MKRKIIIVVVALLILLLAGVGIYRAHQVSLSKQAFLLLKEVAQKEQELDDCLLEVKVERWEVWKLNCYDDFVYDDDGEIESCSVSQLNIRWINEQEQQDKDFCFKRYPLAELGDK